MFESFVLPSQPLRSLSSFAQEGVLCVRKLAVVAMLAWSGIAVMALVVAIGAARVSAQIRTYTPPQTAAPGADWTKR
jgi:hypothetical protein